MNKLSPLLPDGSNLQQSAKTRTRARLAVFFVCVLAVHVIGLMALLMAGCKREQPRAEMPDTNAVLPVFEPTNLPPVETNVPAPQVAVPTPVVPPVAQPLVEQPPGPQEYIVAKGDTFYSIGKQFGVSMRSIQDANPGVNPNRLQIGQKLLIPTPSGSAGGAAGKTVSAGTDTGAGQIYVVKSGDTLSKIAAAHGTTVKALRAANNLKTDRIVVGQKLKIPGSAASPAAAAPPPPIPAVPAEPVPLMPPPAPATPPQTP